MSEADGVFFVNAIIIFGLTVSLLYIVKPQA